MTTILCLCGSFVHVEVNLLNSNSDRTETTLVGDVVCTGLHFTKSTFVLLTLCVDTTLYKDDGGLLAIESSMLIMNMSRGSTR